MSNPCPHKTLCQYAPKDEPCGQEIVPDRESYSGWRHKEGQDWLHWASPKRYGLGESGKIFTAARCNGED